MRPSEPGRNERAWRTYVINMAGAEARWSFMTQQLERLAIPFERFEAVDGSTLAYPIAEFDERLYRLLHGRARFPAEIGCYLSHIGCFRAFLASDAAYALILEDDGILAPDLAEVIDAAIAAASDWDILRLETVSSGRKYRFRKLTPNRHLAIAVTREKGSAAYVVSRRAAETLVRKLLPMRLAFDIAYDLEYRWGLKSVFVDPQPVRQDLDRLGTQIQGKLAHYKLPRTRYLTVLPYRLQLEARRLLIRGGRYARLRLRAALSG